MYTKIEQISHVADNVVDGRIKIKTMPMLKSFEIVGIPLCAARAEASFYVSTVEFGQVVDVNRNFRPMLRMTPRFTKGCRLRGFRSKRIRKILFTII